MLDYVLGLRRLKGQLPPHVRRDPLDTLEARLLHVLDEIARYGPTPDRSLPAQNAVLQALAPVAFGLPFPDLAARVRYPEPIVQAALETLERHDVVVQREGRWTFTVELMRRWVATRHPGSSGGNR
jgi:hypothetical protein